MNRPKTGTTCHVLSIFGLSPLTALACSCIHSPGHSEDAVIEAICTVDVVFVGKVESALREDHSLVSRIVPNRIFKGKVTGAVVAESSTNCEHWYLDGEQYLIFGMIEPGSTRISTSICGPTGLTRRLEFAETQMRIVEEYSDRIDEVCGESESNERRLRLLEETRNPGGVDYDQLLEETRTIQEDGR